MGKFNDYIAALVAELTDNDLIVMKDAETNSTKKITLAVVKAWVKNFSSIHLLPAKTARVGADELALWDSASDTEKKITVNDFLSGFEMFGTSDTSRPVALGTTTFAVKTGLSFLIGTPRVRISASADHANFVEGVVTSYAADTGVLSVTVDRIGGSGTFNSWLVGVAGEPGKDGAGGGSVSSISNANGSVSVQPDGSVLSEKIQDFPNHQSAFYAGFKTASGIRWGMNIGGSRNSGNFKSIEMDFPNCEQVVFPDAYKFQFVGAIAFPDGVRAANHQDFLITTAGDSSESLGLRVKDLNNGRTRVYFSGGVVIGYDDTFTTATTLTNSRYAVYFDTSATNIVQPLPNASGLDGREYVFFKATSDANTLTISPSSGQGIATVLSALDSSVTYRAFNGKWRKIAQI